jgi:hypothetical protein
MTRLEAILQFSLITKQTAQQQQWDAMDRGQRLKILSALSGTRRVKARLGHKIVAGKWADLGSAIKAELQKFDWGAGS